MKKVLAVLIASVFVAGSVLAQTPPPGAGGAGGTGGTGGGGGGAGGAGNAAGGGLTAGQIAAGIAVLAVGLALSSSNDNNNNTVTTTP